MIETVEQREAKERIEQAIQAELHLFDGWDADDVLVEWVIVVATSDPKLGTKPAVGGLAQSTLAGHHCLGLLHTSIAMGWDDEEDED